MKKLMMISLLFSMLTGSALANFSVSPVIIEATNVRKGDLFRIVCEQGAAEPVAVELSLALFDQDQSGRVYFLEDPNSILQVHSFLNLKESELSLESQGRAIVELEVVEANFSSLYAVLFVKPNQAAISTRFAVLLLLSSQGLQEKVQVATWEKRGESLDLVIENSGARHGLWQGELLLYDLAGNLCEQRSLQSGLVLAGRSRELAIQLPTWVEQVELKSAR